MIKEDLKALKRIKERYEDPKVSALVSPLISLLKIIENPKELVEVKGQAEYTVPKAPTKPKTKKPKAPKKVKND